MNDSTATARALISALVALGVRHAVLSPGSRSAPLAYALAQAEAEDRLCLHVRIDERSAGFVALGIGRATAQPAVVVMTSGTAVANLHPAVLEAAHAQVPLIVLSADRPHSLRGTGASQTTDQVHLFGSAARLFAELPAGDRDPDRIGSLAARLLAAARGDLGGAPGPVHLNIGFAEPLVPDDDSPLPPARVPVIHPIGEPSGVLALTRGPRTLVVAGDGAGSTAREVAERGGWPLLAEPSSGARCGANLVAAYRLVLGSEELVSQVERVIVLGRPTLSRPVMSLLARPGIEVVTVAPRGPWFDPAAKASVVVAGVVVAGVEVAGVEVAGVEVTAEGGAETAGVQWLHRWLGAGERAHELVLASFGPRSSALTGPGVALLVAEALCPGDVLLVAASNAVRDFDLIAPGLDETVAVHTNRGLAGIDGTLSSAIGLALARRPDEAGAVRVLIGDLALLHDLNALLQTEGEPRPNLQIVLVDDHGGGIFELLEHGGLAQIPPGGRARFERLFGTPQMVDLAGLCAGFGVRHTPVTAVRDLVSALAKAPEGIEIVHVRLRRDGLRARHAQVRHEVQELLSGL